MPCLLPHAPPRCLSHTRSPPARLTFLVFSWCVLAPTCICVGSGFLVRGLEVRCESPELASETHLCSMAGPAPLAVCDLRPFLELLGTLLTAGHTHSPPLMGF